MFPTHFSTVSHRYLTSLILCERTGIFPTQFPTVVHALFTNSMPCSMFGISPIHSLTVSHPCLSRETATLITGFCLPHSSTKFSARFFTVCLRSFLSKPRPSIKLLARVFPISTISDAESPLLIPNNCFIHSITFANFAYMPSGGGNKLVPIP